VIDFQDLVSNFAGAANVGRNVYRCEDVTAQSTHYYYLRSGSAAKDADILLVSENLQDDEFAMEVLASLPDRAVGAELAVELLQHRQRGFSHLLLAPPEYHRHFAGVLDAKRQNLTLCLPIHRCEFSGKESVEEFFHMRRHTVPTLDWTRGPFPKIALRFDNPRTGGGTGDAGVIVRFDVLAREIANLNAADKGFIECTNWSGRVIEVLPSQNDEYVLIEDRNDAKREKCNGEFLLKRIWDFLVNE